MNPLALALLLTFTTSCDPLQPPPGTPECEAGTMPKVCRTLNRAECTKAGTVADYVTGCYVADKDDPRIKLVCVAPSACD